MLSRLHRCHKPQCPDALHGLPHQRALLPCNNNELKCAYAAAESLPMRSPSLLWTSTLGRRGPLHPSALPSTSCETAFSAASGTPSQHQTDAQSSPPPPSHEQQQKATSSDRSIQAVDFTMLAACCFEIRQHWIPSKVEQVGFCRAEWPINLPSYISPPLSRS